MTDNSIISACDDFWIFQIIIFIAVHIFFNFFFHLSDLQIRCLNHLQFNLIKYFAQLTLFNHVFVMYLLLSDCITNSVSLLAFFISAVIIWNAILICCWIESATCSQASCLVFSDCVLILNKCWKFSILKNC